MYLERMEIGPDIYSKRKPFALKPPTREGGRELWEAFFSDAKRLITEAYSAREAV